VLLLRARAVRCLPVHLRIYAIIIFSRLPRSYVKWIGTLANLDEQIIDVLKYIRKGTWSYIAGSPQHHRLLQASARDLGLPAAWGDPTVVPAYGGSIANEAWKKLGLFNRPSVGGIPCEILHAEVGSSLGLTSSCTANACLRTLKGFVEALAIYLPVRISYFLPSTNEAKIFESRCTFYLFY
jgi:hypothetical protein